MVSRSKSRHAVLGGIVTLIAAMLLLTGCSKTEAPTTQGGGTYYTGPMQKGAKEPK